MKTDFTIRQAQQSDAVALKELFQNTVLVINRRDYSQAEVEDWASCGNNLSNIKERIETHYFVVATNRWFFIYYASRLFTFYVCPQGFSR
jgi:putative acetyltransferase